MLHIIDAFPARSRHHAIMHTLEHDKKQVEGNAALRYQCFYVICFISKHFARLTRQTRRQTRIKHNLLTIRTKDWSALRPLRAKCKTLGRVVFAVDCAELITAPSYHWLADSWHRDWDVWCRHASCPHLVRWPRVQAGTSVNWKRVISNIFN